MNPRTKDVWEVVSRRQSLELRNEWEGALSSGYAFSVKGLLIEVLTHPTQQESCTCNVGKSLPPCDNLNKF
jgi:hypothetical protein